jgi:hypothetical protein
MKTKQSLVCGLIAVVLVLAFGACSGKGQKLTGPTYNFTFTAINDKTAYKVSKGMATQGAMNIPAYYRPDAKSAYLPITEIGAFDGCTGLTSISIPASVTAISSYAFSGCTSLTNITVNNNPNYVIEGGILFNKAKNQIIVLSGIINGSITIPEGVTEIGGGMFRDCVGLNSITIPASVTAIGNLAFSGCTSLSSVIFANGSKLETIGYVAFGDCTSLTGITIPANVTAIGDYAFGGCTSLTGITVDNDNPHYASENGILYNKAKTQIIAIPGGISGSIAISEGVTEIGSKLGFGAITGISIPASVTAIGSSAFGGCTSLASITFANGSKLKTIGDNAFANCTSLASLTIPASVTSIDVVAFFGWTSSQTINIQGKANRAATISAGWNEEWDSWRDARINYLGK